MSLSLARTPLSSSGNAVVLVLVDSRCSEQRHVPETVFAALHHFGIPYRVHDLAASALTRQIAEDAALLLLAQDNLGLCMSDGDVGTILRAVEGGVGLVSLDPKIDAYDSAYADALGLSAGGRGRFARVGVTAVGATDTGHFINHTQASGASHRLCMPIPGIEVKPAHADVRVLAETDVGTPTVVATRLGQGRAVQWLVSSRLWMRQFLGHAKGLDDLFWKGIVWAARKPFALLPMPNFTRIRLDDCSGLYRSAEDMAFVDVLNRHGHKPNLCICMNALDGSGWQTLKRLHDNRLADISPHTWEGDVSLFYGNANGEYSTETAGRLIRATRDMMRDHRITPSRILSDHNHECSVNALPHLHELGLEFKMNVMLPGETWDGLHQDWQPAPYGSMSYCFDTIPGEYPLFVAFTHHPNFDFCRAFLTPDIFSLSRDGGFAEYGWDFLNGLTTSARGANDLEQMAQRLAAHTRLGINSLFFGGSVSHSHFTTRLSVGEWDQLLTRADQLMAGLEAEPERYDVIAAYARARSRVQVAHAATSRDGRMVARVRGNSDMPLRLRVYEEDSDRPRYREHTFDQFQDEASLSM